MDAEKKVCVYLGGKLCPGLQGHVFVLLVGQIHLHIVIEQKFLIHGQGRGHGHGFLQMAILHCAKVFAPMPGIDDCNHFLSLSCLLQPGSRLHPESGPGNTLSSGKWQKAP